MSTGIRSLLCRRFHEAALALLLVILLVIAGWLDRTFLSLGTQLELSAHAAELALLSLPATYILLTGGIDLSVGAAMALCAVVFGLFHEAGASLAVAVSAALLAGVGSGLLNGVFVAVVGVHPLIVTLATMAAFRGIAEGISLGRPISGFPEHFAVLGQGSLAGAPLSMILFGAAAALSAIILGATRWGRYTRAVGFNEQAAALAGVPVTSLKMTLYALSGLSAAMAALVFASRRNTAKADIGLGLELEVITAVVLGGTSVFGGRGTVLGTVLGVALIHELREFISWRFNRDEIILMIVGALLLTSVLPQILAQRRAAATRVGNVSRRRVLEKPSS